MVDVIIVLLLLLIIGGAVTYIVKQKKKGVKTNLHFTTLSKNLPKKSSSKNAEFIKG